MCAAKKPNPAREVRLFAISHNRCVNRAFTRTGVSSGPKGRSDLTTEADRMERGGRPLDGSLLLATFHRSRRRTLVATSGRGSRATAASAGVATTVAAAIAVTAVAAAIAATVATAVATTMAAMLASVAIATAATMTTTMASMTAVAAAAIASAGARAAVASAAAVTGFGLVLAAQQRQADDREENRDTKRQNTIHPRCLPKQSNLT